MSLFSDEGVVTSLIKIHPFKYAAAGELTPEGITLTLGDVILFKYLDKDGTAHVVVATNSDTLAIRT